MMCRDEWAVCLADLYVLTWQMYSIIQESFCSASMTCIGGRGDGGNKNIPEKSNFFELNFVAIIGMILLCVLMHLG